MAKTKLNGFQTVAAIFLQAIGKPVKSAISPCRGRSCSSSPWRWCSPSIWA